MPLYFLNLILILSVDLVMVQSFRFQFSSSMIQMQGVPAATFELQEKPATEEVNFTPEELKEYYKVYDAPDVKYLRIVFNAYLAGTRGKEKEYEVLRGFDKEYYKSKFIVLAVNGGILGGNFITIMFQDRPDKAFKAWVYKRGKYELRAFEPAKFSEDVVKRIQVRYRKFLQDKKHAM